jgi:hypothetical protein
MTTIALAKSQRLAQRFPRIFTSSTIGFTAVENITISFDKKRFPA